MGLIYSKIMLRNPVHAGLEPMEVSCLVNTGYTYLVLPQSIATQLKLEVLQDKEATIADGTNGHRLISENFTATLSFPKGIY